MLRTVIETKNELTSFLAFQEKRLLNCIRENKQKFDLNIVLQLFKIEKIKFTAERLLWNDAVTKLFLLTQLTIGGFTMSTTTHIFDKALIEKFTPMIHKLIKQQVYGYQSSDVCYEWQDLESECHMHLYTATIQYDNTKGMKFENFVYLKLASRLGNFRNKISKHNFKTSNFTDMNGWDITGSEVENDRDSGFSSKMRGQVEYDQQDIMNEIIDAKTVLTRLQGDRLKIYADFYIEGKTVKEICEDNSHLKYYQVRRVLKYLEQIHKTMVEGNVCLS